MIDHHCFAIGLPPTLAPGCAGHHSTLYGGLRASVVRAVGAARSVDQPHGLEKLHHNSLELFLIISVSLFVFNDLFEFNVAMVCVFVHLGE